MAESRSDSIHGIYIRCVASATTEPDIRTHFGQCGTIASVSVKEKPMTSRQFAFVNFTDDEAVSRALALNDTELHGEKLHIERRTSKPQPQPATLTTLDGRRAIRDDNDRFIEPRRTDRKRERDRSPGGGRRGRSESRSRRHGRCRRGDDDDYHHHRRHHRRRSRSRSRSRERDRYRGRRSRSRSWSRSRRRGSRYGDELRYEDDRYGDRHRSRSRHRRELERDSGSGELGLPPSYVVPPPPPPYSGSGPPPPQHPAYGGSGIGGGLSPVVVVPPVPNSPEWSPEEGEDRSPSWVEPSDENVDEALGGEDSEMPRWLRGKIGLRYDLTTETHECPLCRRRVKATPTCSSCGEVRDLFLRIALGNVPFDISENDVVLALLEAGVERSTIVSIQMVVAQPPPNRSGYRTLGSLDTRRPSRIKARIEFKSCVAAGKACELAVWGHRSSRTQALKGFFLQRAGQPAETATFCPLELEAAALREALEWESLRRKEAVEANFTWSTPKELKAIMDQIYSRWDTGADEAEKTFYNAHLKELTQYNLSLLQEDQDEQQQQQEGGEERQQEEHALQPQPTSVEDSTPAAPQSSSITTAKGSALQDRLAKLREKKKGLAAGVSTTSTTTAGGNNSSSGALPSADALSESTTPTADAAGGAPFSSSSGIAATAKKEIPFAEVSAIEGSGVVDPNKKKNLPDGTDSSSVTAQERGEEEMSQTDEPSQVTLKRSIPMPPPLPTSMARSTETERVSAPLVLEFDETHFYSFQGFIGQQQQQQELEGNDWRQHGTFFTSEPKFTWLAPLFT